MLEALQEKAADNAAKIEIPSPKTKGWEFIDLSKFDFKKYKTISGGDLDVVPSREPVIALDNNPSVLNVGSSTRYQGIYKTLGVTVAGLFNTTPKNMEIVEKHLGSLVFDTDKFAAENTATFKQGVLVHVAEDVVAPNPIVITNIQDQPGTVMPWRSLIVVEAGAEVTVIEQYLSAQSPDDALEAYFNPVTEIIVGPGAKVNYLCIQDLSRKTWLLGSQRAVVAEDAEFHWITLGLGSAQGKLRMETDLCGQGAYAKITGAYSILDKQHLNYETTQEHFARNTTSDLSFRGILRDEATVVWSGMIKVDPGAQKTDAFQESRNLLLSVDAHADAIPGLEISADDVRCTHATTISRLNQDQLFYLRSRGLPKADAEQFLVEGFLETISTRINNLEFLYGPVTLALREAAARSK